jgi:tRNA pseudouridine55 synthase
MPTGILLLDKPQGLTSNGALQRVRKAFGARSAGHVGTLDPMATGMLPMCLDEATKVIAEIESGAKCYEFTVQFGARTDTGDAQGQLVERQPVPPLGSPQIEAVAASFLGIQRQIPPMYSALKRQGRPLYELARQGVEVERTARSIEIRRLEMIGMAADAANFVCECAKGTYIRVLGEDLARALGTVGHLTRLRRLWVAPFRDMPMVALEVALRAAESGAAALMQPDAALLGLPMARLTSEQEAALRHGQAVRSSAAPDSPIGRRVRVYGPAGVFLGLAEARPDGWLQPRRLIAPENS